RFRTLVVVVGVVAYGAVIQQLPGMATGMAALAIVLGVSLAFACSRWIVGLEDITVTPEELIRRSVDFGRSRTVRIPLPAIESFILTPGSQILVEGSFRQGETRVHMTSGRLEARRKGEREGLQLAAHVVGDEEALAWLRRRLERALQV